MLVDLVFIFLTLDKEVNILWEDKKQAAFEQLFYLSDISTNITVNIKETNERKTKGGNKERFLLALILFICFASIPNSTSHEAIPHYMRHSAITK